MSHRPTWITCIPLYFISIVSYYVLIVKWVSVFTDFCGTIIGVRDVPITYVFRSIIVVPDPPSPRLLSKPYSRRHGSVQAELIARVSHSHPVFNDDRARVFDFVEEATRGTSYSSTITPSKATKDGCSAMAAMESQHAGVDKWEAIVKKAEHQMRNSKFKGTSQLTLEKHCDQHRQNFIYLQEAKKYVSIQIPTGRTRVTLLLDSIECQDAYLLSLLANVRSGTTLREDFEASVTLILPADPVARKKGKNETNRQLEISAIEWKKGIGKTGVELRFHPQPEYSNLSDDQMAELREWRNTEEGQAAKARDMAKKRKKGPPLSSNKNKKKQKAAIRKQVSSALATERKNQSDHFVEANALISLWCKGLRKHLQPFLYLPLPAPTLKLLFCSYRP